MFEHATKRFRVVFCEVGERLSVEPDASFFQRTDQFRIGDTILASSSVDAEREQLAEVALLGAAVSECVGAGVVDRFFCDALFALTVEAIALGLRQDIFTAFILGYPSFYSCHIGKLAEETALCSVVEDRVKASGAVMALTFGASAFRIEMVLARRTCDDLAALCNAEPLHK